MDSWKTVPVLEEEERDERIGDCFREEIRQMLDSHIVNPSQLFNADQSRFQKEMHSHRVFRSKGAKHVYDIVGSVSESSHSFIIMPVISVDVALLSPMYVKVEGTKRVFPRHTNSLVGTLPNIGICKPYKNFVKYVADLVISDTDDFNVWSPQENFLKLPALTHYQFMIIQYIYYLALQKKWQAECWDSRSCVGISAGSESMILAALNDGGGKEREKRSELRTMAKMKGVTKCKRPKTTFTKLEQRSWIKIEVTRGRSAQECFQGLREACADAALPYRTVAQWVKTFREGRHAVQDNLRTGRSRVDDNIVQLLASLLDADRRWTARELAAEVGGFGYPMKFPRFNNGTTMQSHRPCWTSTKEKMTAFLDESLLWTKPGLAHTNQPNLKRQSNEWKHPGSSRPKKVHPTQSAVKVMFIVAYDTDGVILHHAVLPRQTANADYYCRFLQHHLLPALRRKRRHLVVQNPIILHDNARSHTAAAVKDLLRRWHWEILEHPPYSPDMSPCDYDLFAKMKEPLRGTRYNTRDELIRGIGR
ncbi:hypothetical protein ANN_22358 [Periplaneta americana]|uniref:Mariner Mos1 transposase n=1 Tax=Periplaneta americana TaxID=6978 RepID=A0ABQ8S889_PERAM|nr:hypothetical protein ANN_22358 [Periplaneta americana]